MPKNNNKIFLIHQKFSFNWASYILYGNPLWFSILLRNPDLTNPKISSTVLPSHTIFAVNSHSNSLHTQYIPRWSMTLTSKRATFSIMSHLSALLTFFSSLQIESWVHLWVPFSIFTNFQTRLSSVNSFFKVTSKCSFPLPFYCHHPSPDCHLLNSPFKPSLLFWSIMVFFLPYIRGMSFCNLCFSKCSHVTAQRTRFSKQLLCRIPAYQHTWLLTPCPPEDMWAGSQSFCDECGTAGSGVSLGLNPNPAIDSYGLRQALASFGPNCLICEMRAVLRSYDRVD